MVSSGRSDARTAILEAASQRFAEAGYHGVGLEKIAAAAGVSRQAIYLHFGSKANLLIALGQYQHDRAGVRPLFDEAVWSAPDAVAALDGWVAGLTTFAPHILGLVTTIDVARRSDPDAAALHQSQSASRHNGCCSVTERLAQEGLLASPWTESTAADLLWAVCSVQFYEQLVVERGWSPDAFTEHLQRMLRQVLVHDSQQ